MASLSLSLTSMSLRPPELSSGNGNYGNTLRKKPFSVSVAANSPAPPEKPEIELEFIGPKAESDGSYPLETAKAISGEKLLRNIMLDNKIELYATYGKVMNCGGGGSCGTCIVEEKDIDATWEIEQNILISKANYQIIDGKDLLNERTNTELRYLKKKPESWRLACQTIVGNKENSGKVVVQRIPQWKK